MTQGPCGKGCYKTAQQALSRAVSRCGKANTNFLRVYYCGKCHAYHLTSKKRLS